MLHRQLSQVLLRWELDPPSFSVEERERAFAYGLSSFQGNQLLREATPAEAMTCTECGVTRQVMYLRDAQDTPHGYIACSDCGPTRLRPEQLDRTAIDTPAVLEHLFADARLSVRPLIADHLWRIGRAKLASRSRELWFMRGVGVGSSEAIFLRLSSRPKTILFTPSEATALHWSDVVHNRIIALERVIDSRNDQLRLDWEAVEDEVMEAEEMAAPRTESRPKRASRAAKIERLIAELKQHLHAAADHAHSTADADGYPELLPRPTQERLARQTGMSKSDVSRCLSDESANELRVLWQTANDLNAILRLPRLSLR